MNSCNKVEGISDKTSWMISCDICVEQFTHGEGYVPRVLPCGHTFCEGCIDMLKTLKRGHRAFDYTVTCPRCLNETVINQCTSTLPKNYNYLDLIEDVLERQKRQTCADHEDYVLDMFCHDESQAICLNCAIYGQHKTHCYSRLSEFCDHKRTSMKYQIDSAECLIRDCRGLQKQVEARKEKLEDEIVEAYENLISMFETIQREIKETLDAKLKSVLDDLECWSDSQTTLLDENLTQLKVSDLESLKEKANSFLKNASECEIAKETALPNDIQTCLDEVPTRKLHTQHKFEIQIDSWKHIIETMKDLINGWNCQVTEKEKLTTDVISSVIEKHSPSIESSVRVLFDENEAATNADIPFEGIDFTYEIP